ncbi:MAG: extensin family protein, partial [Variovorax sp.]
TVKPGAAGDSPTQEAVAADAGKLPWQPSEWSAQDIEAAQARCSVLLKGLDVEVEPATPWREGSECGTPAPMKLISIGKTQQRVMLSPPVDLTCDMIAALHKWVQQDLQPLARKHLGEPLVRIEAMSSYSCRNAYGRARSRLSEHGRVNALDIGAFITARGQTARVVADWGMTAREIKAAASKAGETTAEAKTAPAASKDKQDVVAHTAKPAARPSVVETSRAGMLTVPGISIQMPRGTLPETGSIGLAPASRLGGPKPLADTEPNGAALNGRMDFLRGAHQAACRIFGTVLGPEANSAHKNHFHVDMADRKGFTICE